MASNPVQSGDEAGAAPGGAVRSFDWAATPLGPLESWPASLRVAADLCLASSSVAAVYWGEDLRLIYNQPWADVLPERYEAALGKPAREVWKDVWHLIADDFQQVITSGTARTLEAQMLPLVRGGAPEETYWSYTLTPIFEGGRPAGIFLLGADVTQPVLNEQRLSFLIKVADRLRGVDDPIEAKRVASALLGEFLGAARVGFVEVDEAANSIELRSDWTRSPDLPSLTGRTAPLSNLPKAAIDYLRTGQVLAIANVDDLAQGSSEEDSALGDKLGVKAVITVPLVREGRLRAMLFVHETEPRRWKRSEAAMARDVAERSWAAVERVLAEKSLRDSEDHYRHAVELNPQVSWTSLPDGQLNRVSKRWSDWTGTPGTGESWAGGLHPDDVERTFAVWKHSVATGEPYDIEHRVKFRNGSYRWARSRAFPRCGEKGEIVLWYGATEDIHERKRAEERQQLLINELNHRVKNTLATVQAIAFQTLKGDIPLGEARARFEARLLALSQAHNMLTEQNWEGAPLQRVVAEATQHLADRNRMKVEGEDLWLAPRAALALSLALHELSTNAAKYGALSSDKGRVEVSWRTDGDRLRLVWKERDGPIVEQPIGRGFGSRLIERGLTADLGGTANLSFEPDGVRCTIEGSLAAVQARESRDG
nr:HWE histidine kinase domain-containing protein [uncultured Sphingosinicella sp.]